MPEQMIICPNCANGCKLIKQCFIEDSGGGGVEYRSNINKCLEWFVFNRLSDTEVWSLLLSSSLSRVPCLCIPVCPPLFFCLDVLNVKTNLIPLCMKQVTSVEVPFVMLPFSFWQGQWEKWISSQAFVCIFVQIHTTYLCLFPGNWTLLLL